MTLSDQITSKINDLNKLDDDIRKAMPQSDTPTHLLYIRICSELHRSMQLFMKADDQIKDAKQCVDYSLEAMNECISVVDRLINNVDKGHIPESVFEDAKQLLADYKTEKNVVS